MGLQLDGSRFERLKRTRTVNIVFHRREEVPLSWKRLNELNNIIVISAIPRFKGPCINPSSQV